MKSTTAKNGRPIFTAAKKNNYDWVWSNDDCNPSSCEDGGGEPPEREPAPSTKLKYVFFGAMLAMVLLAFAVVGVYMVRCTTQSSTLVVVSDRGVGSRPDDFFGDRTIPNVTWIGVDHAAEYGIDEDYETNSGADHEDVGSVKAAYGDSDYGDSAAEEDDDGADHHSKDGGADHLKDGDDGIDYGDGGAERDVVISNQTIVIFENGTAIRQKRYVYDGALSDSSSNDVVITGNVHVSSGSAVISTIGNWSKSDD